MNLINGNLDLVLIRKHTLVEQELSTLPEHLRSPPVFSGVRVTRALVLCACLSFCLCFPLAIVLSVLLRITDSDYPFGIVKLFLASFLKLYNRIWFSSSRSFLNYLAFQCALALNVPVERYLRNELSALN